MKPSKFKAYSYIFTDDDGVETLEPSLVRQMQFWKPVRMQMVFTIHGSYTKAVVSLEAAKSKGIAGLTNRSFDFKSFIVELPNDNATYVLHGSEDDGIDTTRIKVDQ